jgi:cytoskeleton protein RodZ
LRGYIRNYARALGIDSGEIEAHIEHVRGSEPAIQSVFTVATKRGRTERWLKASSYLAASAVIAALAWQFTHEAVRFSQGDSQLAAATAVQQENGAAQGDVASPQQRPANTHLNASIASVEVMQQPGERGGKVAAEQAWAAIGGQTEAAPAIPGLHRLSVTTSADSWVEIVDGQGVKLELDLIRAGSQRDYSGTGPFRVMVGRASAVGLSLDGEPIDLAPHTRGNVARLTLLDTVAASDGQQPAESVNR